MNIPALIAALLLAWASTARADDNRAIAEAFYFGYPLWQTALTRDAAISRVGNLNRLNHRPRLSNASDRNVTTPNGDTLYSAAWLDLGAGPLRLGLPNAAGRYRSAALMDMFGDHFAVLGSATPDLKEAWIVGPDWVGRTPPGVRLVRAPMRDAWLIVRVGVSGDDDLAAARAVQQAFTLAPVNASPVAAAELLPLRREASPAAFLASVNAILARGPLPERHRSRMHGWQSVGVEAGDLGSFEGLSPELQTAWAKQWPLLLQSLKGALERGGRVTGGWSWSPEGIGQFGRNDRMRAAVALSGLGALPATEAVYLTRSSDADGQPLDGRRCRQLDIPPHVPAGAFWSLSLYEVTSDGQQFFVPNSLGRYRIASFDTALAEDGHRSLTITTDAGHRPGSTWLPAPRGPYTLVFRVYRPKPGMDPAAFSLPAPRPCPGADAQ